MKIRMANIEYEGRKVGQVYLHENKKEETTLIAIPDLEWSTVVSYEEEIEEMKMRVFTSLKERTNEEVGREMTAKINYWVREM
ncbi:YueH family protein [Priestia filamentosa]|uniref:YueH family protein n=1 Tax=Priestia TaxID=2800373 RepID=UPI001FB1E220|nr:MULTISPECIES: YueH family protein [Priestia]MCY8234032.1 YueH family protein [Priestia endophytica]MED3726204.1 YueH family protein [Priestia filamentosa]UOE59345.1 YueH family protein [Priestia filamentosa]